MQKYSGLLDLAMQKPNFVTKALSSKGYAKVDRETGEVA